MNELIFSGGSHHGSYALKSVQKLFEKVYIFSNNSDEILSLKRKNDVLIKDFEDVDCPYVFLGGHTPFINRHQLEKKIYINVHGALLPKYRGMHSTFWAIVNEERELGVTFHLVDEYMDSGDIISQYNFDYTGQSIAEINLKIDTLIYEHAGNDILNFIKGNISPIPQNHNLATFGCKRNLDDCLIDFTSTIHNLTLFFKALTPPYPLPRIKIKDRVYEVTKSNLIYKNYISGTGRVLNIDSAGIWIKVSDGFLIVSELKDVQTELIINPCDIVKIGYRFQ